MGRGRQKAKQTKVARDLKYRSVDTDFASLERELRGEPHDFDDPFDETPDKWADLAARYQIDDDLDDQNTAEPYSGGN
ncbi:MAG: DUF3073 domain-containing protein [Propionibacteriaceae bacterium]|jgi:hypothetical protein|nr:DUF3073 domain-containing protein [Propionibacteriaceae bacterium]